MSTTERTGIQSASVGISLGLGTQQLAYSLPASYATYRTIRKDPTIAMVRMLISAGIVSAGRAVEKDDDVPEAIHRFIVDQIFPHTEAIVERAILDGIDFGWSPFEIVLSSVDGQVTLSKVKPLLQDITAILVDDRGNFVGFIQNSTTVLPFDLSLLIPWRVEGSNWYGYPLLENARDVFTQWGGANATAQVYDSKVAGTRLVIYYPPGQSKDSAGTLRENSDIAQEIMGVLELSGSVTVPTTAARWVDELEKQSTGWRIEVLDDKGPNPSQAIERLKYLDMNKCRALGMPERVILEGSIEVKADSIVPAQFALRNMEIMHAYVCKHIQKIIDLLLTLNYGAEWIGKVYVVPGAIVEEGKELLGEVAMSLIEKDPSIVDANALLDKALIPKASEKVKQVTQVEEPNASPSVA
jgi:hypothetical protein